ncbi:MAG: xanthine dehydrogenase family protein subunit M [Myxococcales bacterium]|nr:xanthine dehydrogenase family protein subunit M [Myxococcales bacterium]
MSEPLRLFEPTSVEAAVGVLAALGDDAKVVAGATALTLLYRQRLIAPGALVSIGRIPGLDGIEVADGELHLGALVTHRAVELSPVVRSAIPVVASTFGKVANVRVRNAATVGGVLAESDYASDPPALFLALDAVVDVQGPGGRRSIPVAEFFIAFYETALAHDELVTGVRVPIPPAGTGAVYHKFVTRSSEDRPCVGVAGLVRLDADGTVADLRVAVGAAAETPQRYRDAEALALGQRLDPDVIARIADAYADRVDTLDDMRGSAWYRTEMVRVWVRRAIESAAATAPAP